MGRIDIISNREPDPSKPERAGGVAVALGGLSRSHSCVFAGWDGRIDTEIAPKFRHRRSGTYVTTPLNPEEHHGFYLGYSNSVLWPVFHTRLDLAHFEAGFFKSYSEVNARIAATVAPLIRPDDLVWIHDYQFITLGLELRKLGIDVPIGFFLHIPFPSPQTFMAVPEHRDLAHGLAVYDLVGLQTKFDVGNMLNYLQQGVGGRLLPSGDVRVFDRIVSVESFPIGINPADFERTRGHTFQAQGRPGVKRIIGVDRLDYSKGLPQKLRAFERFLTLAPQYRRKVVLTQIAPPTRESVDAYITIRKELESLSGSINGRFGELDWVPIHYIHRQVQRNKLAEIYRSSDVGLVTPLRDGMNLVAKEYVAAQDPSDPGVLVLSRFAGAAEAMHQALIVNPYNVEEMAHAMLTAIDMPLDQRVTRHASLLATVRQNDVETWSETFIAALAKRGRDLLTGYGSTAAASVKLETALAVIES